MFRNYRRNADSELRETERRFLGSGAADDYLVYLSACQRSSVVPDWCRCASQAIQDCTVCSQRVQLPVRHCQQCSRHLCPGTITIIGEEGQPCPRELATMPKCDICQVAMCTEEDCSDGIIPETCGECEKTYCADDDCGEGCDACGSPVCSECWFECEAHNNQHFCDDCTSRCEQCTNNCCPECICGDQHCGNSICTDCVESTKAGACTVCDARLCDEHNLECSMCEESVCEEHSTKCRMRDLEGTRCGAIICSQCESISCHMCSRASGCPSHFDECHACEESICGKCTEECNKCGNSFDADCFADHEEECISENEDQPPASPALPPILLSTSSLQVGNRVRYLESGLLGTVIKISQKDDVTKYIVEWDNDTAGKHLINELEGPISSRRNYYRH